MSQNQLLKISKVRQDKTPKVPVKPKNLFAEVIHEIEEEDEVIDSKDLYIEFNLQKGEYFTEVNINEDFNIIYYYSRLWCITNVYQRIYSMIIINRSAYHQRLLC